MSTAMKDDLVALITGRQQELRQFGVRRLGLFGSVLRNEQHDASDVDVGWLDVERDSVCRCKEITR